MQQKNLVLDALDRSLIKALRLDARVPFARFAASAGVSEQTVARRFHRLRTAGVLRVVGLVDPTPLGESSWIFRIQSRPDAAVSLADSLARRPDVGWVTLTSGGSEIICVARSRSSRQRDELMLQRLPKTAQVTGFSAHAVLYRFELPGISASSSTEPIDDDPVEIGADPLELDDADEALLAELARDGRTPIVRLAAVTGWTPARAARRVEDLVRIGLLYFDAELAPEVMGLRSSALLWLTVGPADLRATGTALAGHPEVTFVAATTGTTNLFASVVCPDTARLYRYVTESLGALPAIRQVEISLSLRRVKQGGSMMDGDRLATQ